MRFFLSMLFAIFVALTGPSFASTGANGPDSMYNGQHYVSAEEYKAERPRVHYRSHVRGARHATYKKVRHKKRYVHIATKPKVDKYAFDNEYYEPAKPKSLAAKAVDAVASVTDKTVGKIQRAYQFFLDRGYSHHATAGILGNIRAESNFNTRDVGDGGRARFLAQWHPDRQAGLRRLARDTGRDPYDYDVSLEYIDIELRKSETLALRKLHAAQDVEDGTAAFIHFERPQGYAVNRPQRTHDYRVRLKFAREYYREFKDLKARTVEARL